MDPQSQIPLQPQPQSDQFAPAPQPMMPASQPFPAQPMPIDGPAPMAPAPSPIPQMPMQPQQPQAFGPQPQQNFMQPAPQMQQPMQPLPMQGTPISANSVLGKSKVSKAILFVRIGIVAFIIISAIVSYFVFSSKNNFGSLESAMYGNLSFKKPDNWKSVSKLNGLETFTPNGAPTKESYAALGVGSQSIPGFDKITDAEKTAVSDQAKATITSANLAKEFESSDCSGARADQNEEIASYPDTYWARKYIISCAGGNHKDKLLVGAVMLTKKGSIATIDVIALKDVYSKNKATIEEMLLSVREK